MNMLKNETKLNNTELVNFLFKLFIITHSGTVL